MLRWIHLDILFDIYRVLISDIRFLLSRVFGLVIELSDGYWQGVDWTASLAKGLLTCAIASHRCIFHRRWSLMRRVPEIAEDLLNLLRLVLGIRLLRPNVLAILNFLQLALMIQNVGVQLWGFLLWLVRLWLSFRGDSLLRFWFVSISFARYGVYRVLLLHFVGQAATRWSLDTHRLLLLLLFFRRNRHMFCHFGFLIRIDYKQITNFL